MGRHNFFIATRLLGKTMLSDQTAVFGALALVDSLGLELLEVRRMAPG